MLVKKGEVIVRDDIPYQVVCCDEEVFIIGRMYYDPAAGCNMTSYEALEAYSNDETINTLTELNFAKRIKPEKWVD